jgi:hypothetical protein
VSTSLLPLLEYIAKALLDIFGVSMVEHGSEEPDSMASAARDARSSTAASEFALHIAASGFVMDSMAMHTVSVTDADVSGGLTSCGTASAGFTASTRTLLATSMSLLPASHDIDKALADTTESAAVFGSEALIGSKASGAAATGAGSNGNHGSSGARSTAQTTINLLLASLATDSALPEI